MSYPTDYPTTIITPYQTVVLLNGITVSIDTIMSFQVAIEKMIGLDSSEWEVVYSFGEVRNVFVNANIQKTFTEVYGQELTYKVLQEGIYRWNVLVTAQDRNPDTSIENFYSYFTSSFNYFINDTAIDDCDPDCGSLIGDGCDMRWIDDELRQYFCLRGFPVTIYLITSYNPIYIFGEDPTKTFGASFVTKAIWEPSPENKTYGKFEKLSEEQLQLYLHKSTIRKQIREVLLAAGLFSESTIGLPDTEVTKEERWRRELQEGDMIRTNFNNINYEIVGVKQEPDYMYFMNKYVYQLFATPRLVSNENIGDMNPITEADEIRQQHDNEIRIESEKIIF
jgi:hypothetical protein